MSQSDKKIIEKHMLEDSLFQAKFNRIIFGDEATQEVGMKKKVDEMHAILTSIKGLIWGLGLIVMLGSALLVLKSWFIKP